MPRFRCYHCNAPGSPNFEPPVGFEFEADGPRCPSCKRGGMLVVPLTDVHWHEPIPHDEAPQPGEKLPPGVSFSQHEGLFHRIACGVAPHRQFRSFMAAPGRLVSFSATGVLEAVTCPACKATESFQRARAALQE